MSDNCKKVINTPGSSEQENVRSKMSRRLITICEMLKDAGSIDTGSEGDFPLESPCIGTVADIGCDHGYISIYLVQNRIAHRAIAMDVRRGPLDGARSNIDYYGQQDCITTRLSDGLKALSPDEADAVVIAGMGGKLMMKILEEGNPTALGIKKGILQPQSEIPEFRKYLRDKGYSVLDERIVLEDGKYYFPMKVSFEESMTLTSEKDDTKAFDTTVVSEKLADQEMRIFDRFGGKNILRRDPLLRDYCLHGQEVCTSILSSLDERSHPERYREVSEELSDIRQVLELFGDLM